MSNNRNNNRRRGRGNNRSQGGNQLNRIDSRARGNAPQLLEKYRKLAHDASLNGDRVQAEYYLQFADHYFRVIADGKAQKEEGRGRRDAERDLSDDDYDFEDEFDRGDRGRRQENSAGLIEASEPEQGSEGSPADEYEAADNPFIRESRSKPRRPRNAAPRERARNVEARDVEARDAEESAGEGLDPSALPPAIARENEADGDEPAAEKPARRPRRPRARGKDDDAELEAVS